MSFWSDSSPIVKGVVVVGAIGIIISIMAFFELPPFATDAAGEELGAARGIE